MILQSLVDCYDALAKKGTICPAGWSIAKVSLALELAEDGSVLRVLPLKVPAQNGKKEVPQPMWVPEQAKRASGVSANFLCDNGAYFLCIDDKGKPERTKKCFLAAKELHHKILDGVESDAAKAVLAFFDTWQIEKAEEAEVLSGVMDEIKTGANLIFKRNGEYIQEDHAVRAAWEKQQQVVPKDAVIMRCLVTGEEAPVARLHPSIKGVNGAQPSGASLVSYNAPAFESYGHEDRDGTGRGLNAPVSEVAAFKYGTALNYLIADREHVQRIADTTVVYWAQNAEVLYQDIMGMGIFGQKENKIGVKTIGGVLKQMRDGGSINGVQLKFDNPFYILGLAPNASRLSVRFFLQSEFGTMLENLNEHNKRLEIIQPMGEKKELPLWNLLNELADQNAQDQKPPAPTAGAVLRSIVLGTDYPAALFENVMLRIKTERDIKWRKAAILKAYYLKNKEFVIPKEVLGVELNENSTYLPYVLGRLFAVLEKVQTTATPGIKATIRNKYFTSASATPASIFPVLLTLSQHHQRKLSEGSKVYYDKIITDLENRIHETLPARFKLQDQGVFYLGYYHEKQKLFTKNDVDKKEGDENHERGN